MGPFSTSREWALIVYTGLNYINPLCSCKGEGILTRRLLVIGPSIAQVSIYPFQIHYQPFLFTLNKGVTE
ncbi:hypothetical protein IMY05_006G0212000 [Salix suchowensis]|nr:hypothetical protein IMY05_006G0212000 [Salix suchowensis]